MKGLLNLLVFAALWTITITITFGIGLIPLAIYTALVFVGATKRRDRALDRAAETLMAGESFEQVELQHRVFSFWRRRELLGITNSRIVVVRRGLLGGFKMQDIQWKDLEDAKIEENVLPALCGANLAFEHSSDRAPIICVSGIPAKVASEIYRRAQFEEQAWEEKRRLRDMEEVRAAAGGFTFHAGAMASPIPPPTLGATASLSTANPILEEIQRAKELLDAGAISDAEFQEMKGHILRRAVI